jgi:hypothetical protein
MAISTSNDIEAAGQAVEFTSAMDELAALAAQDGVATLGSLLARASQLPPALHALVSRILRARPTSQGWVLAETADPSASPSGSREDRLVAVLREASAPLTDAQVLQCLPEAKDLKNIRSMLLADARIVMAASGGWTLAEKQPYQEVQQLAAPSHPEHLPRQDRYGHLSSLKERAEKCLNDAGHPMTVQSLVDQLGDDVKVGSLRSLLSTDGSFMRSDVGAWALTSWGLRRYTSVRELVAEEVNKAGGTIALGDLEQNLTRDFTIKISTLRQVASTSPFTTSAGIVRRRGDRRSAQTNAKRGELLGQPEDRMAATAEGASPSPEELAALMGLA